MKIKQPLRNIRWAKPGSKTHFNILKGINRPVIPSHVTKLANSIAKLGMLRPVICCWISFIDGKRRNYTLDGQHSADSCERLECDIPYITLEIKNQQELIEVIAMLNSSSKCWQLSDYVTAWSSLEQDYRKLAECHNIYDMELSILASILNGLVPTNGGSISTVIKKGRFRLINEKMGMDIVRNLSECLDKVSRMDRKANRYFCSEYVKFIRSNTKYNHKEFIKFLYKNKEKLMFVVQETNKLQTLFNSYFNKINC